MRKRIGDSESHWMFPLFIGMGSVMSKVHILICVVAPVYRSMDVRKLYVLLFKCIIQKCYSLHKDDSLSIPLPPESTSPCQGQAKAVCQRGSHRLVCTFTSWPWSTGCGKHIDAHDRNRPGLLKELESNLQWCQYWLMHGEKVLKVVSSW